jgi:hypothetical protein
MIGHIPFQPTAQARGKFNADRIAAAVPDHVLPERGATKPVVGVYRLNNPSGFDDQRLQS